VIELAAVSVRQGAFVLSGLNLRIESGRYAVLTGKSGVGKTTLVEVIAGLRPPAAGRVNLSGVDVTGLPPRARGVGYVPQDGVLFRTMTVREHLSFALRIRRAPALDVTTRTTVLAGWLGIEHLLDRKAVGLSGGETQRVALGRALAARPGVLLLDEPLAAQDDDTRAGLTDLLRQLRDARRTTVLHITHNRAEAEALADVRFHMEDGAVRPVG
jgi:ABC-type sugar transport system ATPase subunit